MSKVLREGPIRKWLKERETIIPRKKILGGSYNQLQDPSHQKEFELMKSLGLPSVLVYTSSMLSDAMEIENKSERDLHIEDARRMISYITKELVERGVK